MNKTQPSQIQLAPRHVGVAAEAFAAGQFARYGYDVSVQYGANQPEYDLIVAKEDRLMKISVKGSKGLGWGLTQSYLPKATKLSNKKADYHGAIDLWLKRHGSRTVFCFVQFGGVPLDGLPRMYLATPAEVARRLRETAGGRGDSILHEELTWTSRSKAAGTTEKLPSNWVFTRERINELFKDPDAGTVSQARA